MKFSEQWLREFLRGEVDSAYLLERLTMSGLEVDGIESAAAEFSGVVVAKVLNVEPHPDADKLKICTVDCNDAELLQIVCGAANVDKNMFVALAKIGARLPGDFKIKKSKLRGVESFGMLCSAKELGLAEEADGLIALPTGLNIGEDVRSALHLDDSIIELSLTPNRGDCFSISGIARDVAVFCNVEFEESDIQAIEPVIAEIRAIQLQAPEACASYVGRIIKDVDLSTSSPLWMTEKLRRSGIRSISPVVDITNYVMLELGQPMHAFDNDKLQGAIQVRYAKKGESLTLLDTQECSLDDETLVIADENGPLAMAGIMGGLASSVGDSTQNIFLESAFFTPELIIGDARKYGLHTDSSHRFERGVDFQLQTQAIERATALILEICGGQAGAISRETVEEALPKRPVVTLRAAQIKRILGFELENAKVEVIFEQLGLNVKAVEGGWEVNPPSYRFDINIEADLIEEIARVIGYDNIETQALVLSLNMQVESLATKVLERSRNFLINRAYQEAINYSFIEPELNDLFRSKTEILKLVNPISKDMSVMRSSLLPGLLMSLQYNANRQQQRVRLFESGLVFEGVKALKQSPKLAGVIYGEIEPEQWDKKTSSSDFFDLKSDVKAILGQLSSLDSDSVQFLPSRQKFLHPGQSADISLEGNTIGCLGALHPNISQYLELSRPSFVFELELEAISRDYVVKCSEISKFPSIRRDISLLVDTSIQVAELTRWIKKSASDLLVNLELFDLYEGERIDIGKKSLTFGLTFQRSSSTLIDSEVESLVAGVLDKLRKELGATLRE